MSGTVFGPAFWQFNIVLSKTFQVCENQRLELRVKTFNVTKSLRKGGPVVNLSSGRFGQIVSARDPRIMQFALKYVF